MFLRFRNRSLLCGFDWEKNPEKGDFKITELLTKTLFFLYFRDPPKNGEGSKKDVESICARVTKYTSKYVVKAEFNLN